MAKFEDLAERVDRLVLRHQELKRSSTLIEQQYYLDEEFDGVEFWRFGTDSC